MMDVKEKIRARNAFMEELLAKPRAEWTPEDEADAALLFADSLALDLQHASIVETGSPAEGRKLADFVQQWAWFVSLPDESRDKAHACEAAVATALGLLNSPTFRVISRPNAKTPGTTPRG